MESPYLNYDAFLLSIERWLVSLFHWITFRIGNSLFVSICLINAEHRVSFRTKKEHRRKTKYSRNWEQQRWLISVVIFYNVFYCLFGSLLFNEIYYAIFLFMSILTVPYKIVLFLLSSSLLVFFSDLPTFYLFSFKIQNVNVQERKSVVVRSTAVQQGHFSTPLPFNRMPANPTTIDSTGLLVKSTAHLGSDNKGTPIDLFLFSYLFFPISLLSLFPSFLLFLFLDLFPSLF